MAETTLSLRLTADGKGLVGELRTASGELRRFGTDGGRAADQVTAGFGSTRAGIDSISTQLANARREIVAFFSIREGLELVGQLARIADGYANVQGKLRQVTADSAQLAAVNNQVFAVSQRTSTALDATAQLASKNIRVFLGMGDSMEVAQRKGLALTETLQKALAVSGATGEEARSLVQQLGQALQSGVLQGDEFRSVMENGGRVIQALTAYTGKSVAELRKMAEQGKLTAQIILEAMSSAATKIDAEYKKVPLTIERAWTQLGNAVMRYVGQADQASGTSRRIAEGIASIGRNIDAVISGIVTLGEVVVTVYTAKLLRMGALWIASLVEQAVVARDAASAAAEMGMATSGAFAASVAQAGLLNIALGTIGSAIAGWQIGTWLRENFLEARLAGVAFVDGTLTGWERIKEGGLLAWEYLKFGFTAAIQWMRQEIAGFASDLGSMLSKSIDPIHRAAGAALQALATSIAPTTRENEAILTRHAVAIAKIKGEAQIAVNDVHKLTDEMANYEISAEAAKKGSDAASKGIDGVGKASVTTLPTMTVYAGAMGKAGKSAQALYEDLLDASKGAQLYKQATEAAAHATDSLVRDNESLAENIAQQQDELNGLTREQVQYNAELRNHNQLAAEALALGPPTLETQQAIEQHLRNINQSHALTEQAEAQKAYADATEQAARRVQGYYESIADSIASSLTKGGNVLKNLGRGLVDTLRQIVTDMIAQWLRTRIIGTFMGGGGGGGWGALASMGAAFLGGGGGGGGSSGSGAIGQVASAAFGGGGSGGGFDLFSGSSWMSAGKSLWNGFSSGNGGAFSYFGRGFESAPDFMGPPTSLQGSGTYGGYSSGFGQALGIAGGVYAGYSRYKNTEGGAAGLAGAAAYGVGTYFAGAGAAAALSGGVAAGMAAIPVVGWIALAAMLIDKFSGGKLFGTKFQTKGSTVNLGIGEGGSTASVTLQQERQGALFSGKKKRDKAVDATPEMIAAAEDLFKSIESTMKQAANALQIEVPPVIDASFKTITEYDKKGHAKSTKYLVEAFGKHWEEASAEAAQKRLGAEAILAVVDKASGGVAMKIAEQWQSNVDVLADGVQFLMAAQAALTNKTEILGTTLEGVAEVVTDFAVSGESLAATYSRLTAETKSVQDAFALAGQTLQKTGRDLVEFADDIAQKAGGGEAAQQLWSRFFTSFYSQAELAARQVDQLRPTLNTELSDIGLDPGVTMAEFRTAFEAALPNLSSEDIVKWLKAANDVASFYELSEKAGNAAGGASSAVRNYAAMVLDLDQQLAEAGKGGGISAFQQALAQLGQQEANTIAQMNAAARAAGLQGAREEDLSKVHQLAALRAAAAMRQVDAASVDIVSRLRGNDGLTGAAQSASSALGSVASGLGGVADAAQKFRDSMLLDSQLSPLNAQQQLQEAMTQLRATGDEGTARRALEIARGLTASGADYKALFDQITGLVRPSAASAGRAAGGGAYDASASASTQLSALEREQLAQQLAQNVADKAGFTGGTFADVAAGWGYSLDQLSRDLGFTGDQLTAYLESLQADSYGLTDIKDIYDHNTDRIVEAILHGTDSGTAAASTSPITGTKPGGAETITAPQVNVIATSKGEAPASEKSQQDANVLLSGLLAKMDKFVEVATANIKVNASVGEEVVEAMREVRHSVDDVRREVGSSANGENFRTRPQIR